MNKKKADALHKANTPTNFSYGNEQHKDSVFIRVFKCFKSLSSSIRHLLYVLKVSANNREFIVFGSDNISVYLNIKSVEL